MKVYIASKYIEHKELNRKIYESLISENIDSFLPESINVDAITENELLFVAECCYNEIEECDIILIVVPFGRSVASEIGYAVASKRHNQPKQLIIFNPESYDGTMLKNEAMIMPYIDVEVNSIIDLINYLKNQL